MEKITRTDLCILAVLHQEQANCFMLSLSIDEIVESGNVGASRITVYKHLKNLENFGYVAVGARNNRASCFYITTRGKQILEEEGEEEYAQG